MNPLLVFAPFLSVSAGVILVMGASIARWSKAAIITMTGVLLLLAWGSSLALGPLSFQAWGITFDGLGTLGSQIILPIMLCLMLLCAALHPKERLTSSLLLMLLSSVGAVSVLLSHNWMFLFIAIQAMSLPLYGLIAKDPLHQEALAASFRYLILSALAMAFMLFGILLLYADTQSFDFYVQAQLWRMNTLSPLSLFGLALVLVGICFKLSLVPFHIWTPEVYEGAPSYVVGAMLLMVKTVVLVALMRFSLIVGLAPISYLLSGLALASLVLGNGVLLIEKDFYRFLAFFSVGHMGLLIGALLAQSQLGMQAIFVDIIAFSLSIITVLAILSSLPFHNKAIHLDHFNGLFYKYPAATIMLLIAFLSMIGFPLTGGFAGKYSLIMAIIESKSWVILSGVIISSAFMIAAFTFLIARFFQPVAESKEHLKLSKIALVALAVLLMLGVYPQPFLEWVRQYIS